MSRTRYGSEFSGGPTRFLAVGDLRVDQSTEHPVQRSYDARWGDWIGDNLDRNKLGIVHVSLRKNGGFYIIDGAHRVGAIRSKLGNNGTLVECKVYEGLDRAAEADLFKAINGDRRPVTTLDNFLVSVTAKDPVNSAILNIVQECGLNVSKSAGADGVLRAVGALRSTFLGFAQHSRKTTQNAEPKPELLRATLLLIKSAWGINQYAYDGNIIEGVGRLLAARWKAIDRSRMAQKLAPYPGGPKALLGTARGRKALLGGSVAASVADVMLDAYNKGARSEKVESLR